MKLLVLICLMYFGAQLPNFDYTVKNQFFIFAPISTAPPQKSMSWAIDTKQGFYTY